VEATELVNRLFRNAVGALELYTVYVGDLAARYPRHRLALTRCAAGPRCPRSGGCVIVADERTEDQLTPGAGLIEQSHYGWSVVSCLPSAMDDPQSRRTSGGSTGYSTRGALTLW